MAHRVSSLMDASCKPTMKYNWVGIDNVKKCPNGAPNCLNKVWKKNSICWKYASSVVKTIDGHEYKFYYGEVNITVYSNFGEISYLYANHGYMGGKQFKIFRCLYEVRMSPSIFNCKCLSKREKVHSIITPISCPADVIA